MGCCGKKIVHVYYLPPKQLTPLAVIHPLSGEKTDDRNDKCCLKEVANNRRLTLARLPRDSRSHILSSHGCFHRHEGCQLTD